MARIAALQFASCSDVEQNLATCLRMIDAAAAEGAQVIVLPEFCNHVSWYDDREHSRRMAVTLDGPFVGAIAAKAKEHDAYVMVNVVVAREDGRGQVARRLQVLPLVQEQQRLQRRVRALAARRAGLPATRR